MARVPYFDVSKATGRAAERYAKTPPLNVFRMMGHAGDLVDSFVKLGNHLLIKGKLDPVLREIAIIRTGVLCGSGYEVQQHENIGRKLGMSADLLAAVHAGPDASAFTDLQRQVMAFTDDVVRNIRAGDATFEPLRQHLSLGELQELVVVIGYYMTVSRFLETFDVDLEEDPESIEPKLPGMRS